MTQEPVPIAYTALAVGTSVQTQDGQRFGEVAKVLAVADLDVFDGIVITTEQGVRFVDADQISRIYTDRVETNLSADQAAALPPPDQDSFHQIKPPGRSAADRLGRFFGRGR